MNKVDFLRYQPGLPEVDYPKCVYFKPISERAKEFFRLKHAVIASLEAPDHLGWYCFGWTGHASRLTRNSDFTDRDVKDIDGDRPHIPFGWTL
jgi:hypothetical protein